MRQRIKIEIGKRYGRLVILSEGERHISSSGKSSRTVKCQCDCGKLIEVLLNNINRKNYQQSCGCFMIERTKIAHTKHGLRHHTLYSKFYGMRYRCYNPKSNRYKHYGGRGIRICDEWLNDFQTFYDWAMANGWQEGLEIDRKDNDGNYEPSNCKFVTSQDNIHNQSTTKLNWDDVRDIRNIKLLIPEIRITELAVAFGIHPSTLGEILKNRSWVEP